MLHVKIREFKSINYYCLLQANKTPNNFFYYSQTGQTGIYVHRHTASLGEKPKLTASIFSLSGRLDSKNDKQFSVYFQHMASTQHKRDHKRVNMQGKEEVEEEEWGGNMTALP